MRQAFYKILLLASLVGLCAAELNPKKGMPMKLDPERVKEIAAMLPA